MMENRNGIFYCKVLYFFRKSPELYSEYTPSRDNIEYYARTFRRIERWNFSLLQNFSDNIIIPPRPVHIVILMDVSAEQSPCFSPNIGSFANF